MANYFLTYKAVEDLSEIWDYSFETWSEYQADNHDLGKNYKEISSEIYGYKSGEHIVFYRKLSEKTIEIVRFLHSKMDLKSRILE
ncbi:toxin ParE1/3/4 [Algoriphagus aquaeductus]|uniref:Toxin ParE1/3/4 n=1 Tax=Algoriphagus aquaeductus TaxID=475299 RepID=A0A326RS36_9BACT|nr:type II toxin-antitoxin system RelE/ParE family toxin [Algoriphagus aquaeductus]PZV83430.1 toxin ParE1/3/4 [Algoriphagus aquaeductus]